MVARSKPSREDRAGTDPVIDPRLTRPMAKGLGGYLIFESAASADAAARLELPHSPLAHTQASRGV